MTDESALRSIDSGQRVFTCGHSFHAFISDILIELAVDAGISAHQAAGTSMIGASRAIQHWDVPEEHNEAKTLLRSGTVDVLTLSCMTQPDDGISKFAKLAIEHNADVRVTLQELWLPEDRFPFDPENRTRQSVKQFNESTIMSLRKPHEVYFKVMEDFVQDLNAEIGRQLVFIVPDAQATLALRERIIDGRAPGLSRQSDLFTDAWGHPTPPLQLLSALCHYSVIYRRSPVGLACPNALDGNWPSRDALNLLLQQLAWDAVTQHSLSGVLA